MKNNIELREVFFEEDYPLEMAATMWEFAFSFLCKGRPNFDVPHTLAVVKHVYRIAKERGADIKVLVTAAFLHDIGYYGSFEAREAAGYAEVMDRKARHMIVGAKEAELFLGSGVLDNFLTDEQKNRVVHLVAVHDKITELTDLDELILMKADTLGAIDIGGGVIPTFRGEEAIGYLDKDSAKRRSLFEEKLGSEDYVELATAFRRYILARDFGEA